MDIYVYISFIAGLIGVGLRLLTMLVSDYPIITTRTLSAELALLLIGVGYTIWAGILLYA